MLARSVLAPAGFVLETFARRVSETRLVWTVSGEDGLARLPGVARGKRDVTLCWSTQEAAAAHVTSVARNGRVNPIMLVNFAGTVLPKLKELDRLVAPDWTLDPSHPQFDAMVVVQAIKGEGLRRIASVAAQNGRIYILESDLGPTFTTSAITSGALVLPCWTTAEDAESQVKGFWSEMMVSEIPIEAFVSRTLPWVAGIGRAINLDYGLGGVPLELGALDFAGRLMGQPPRSPAA